MAISKPLTLLLTLQLLAAPVLFAQKKSAAPSLTTYEKYIDNNNEAHLAEFKELISIPSISSIPAHAPDVAKAADWIVNKLLAIGIPTAKTINTGGHPVVFGSWDKAPGKPTVLIYAHYDVQPVKEAEWTIPPFAPQVKDGKIFGRGASDDKSGVMISIWAVEAMLKSDGKLPVNVKFVFEGEEEMGSPNFKSFLDNNKELLKADFAVNADGGQHDEYTPEILMSLRGASIMEFTIKTANIDAHSGQFGGKTPNAAVIMAQMIASFYTKEGNVAVEGFYDKVVPLSEQEKEMLQKIPYDKNEDMKILGTTAEAGDTSFSPLERIWFRPTLEIIGLESGYTAPEGHSNIIPSKAMARITCRLVGNQSGEEITNLIIQHINQHLPPGASVSYKIRNKGIGASPMKFPADTKEYRYIAEVLQSVYGRAPLQMGTGGSIGSLLFIKDILGLYTYSLGFELPDEKWHAANEFFRLSSIRKGQLVYCAYLQQLAAAEGKTGRRVK